MSNITDLYEDEYVEKNIQYRVCIYSEREYNDDTGKYIHIVKYIKRFRNLNEEGYNWTISRDINYHSNYCPDLAEALMEIKKIIKYKDEINNL